MTDPNAPRMSAATLVADDNTQSTGTSSDADVSLWGRRLVQSIVSACTQYHSTRGAFMPKCRSASGLDPATRSYRYNAITKPDVYQPWQSAEALIEQSRVDENTIAALVGLMLSPGDSPEGSHATLQWVLSFISLVYALLPCLKLSHSRAATLRGLVERFAELRHGSKGSAFGSGAAPASVTGITAAGSGQSHIGYKGLPMQSQGQRPDGRLEEHLADYIRRVVCKARSGKVLTASEVKAAMMSMGDLIPLTSDPRTMANAAREDTRPYALYLKMKQADGLAEGSTEGGSSGTAQLYESEIWTNAVLEGHARLAKLYGQYQAADGSSNRKRASQLDDLFGTRSDKK